MAHGRLHCREVARFLTDSLERPAKVIKRAAFNFGELRGNPLIWPKKYLNELKALTGDVGGKQLLCQHREDIIRVPINDDAVILDIDTPQLLAVYKQQALNHDFSSN